MVDTGTGTANTPRQDQIAALLRMSLIAVGSVAGALGFEHVGKDALALMVAVGPVAALVAAVVGFRKTGKLSAAAQQNG